MSKLPKLGFMLAVAIIALPGIVQASTVNQLLTDIAVADGVLGQEKTYLYNDSDKSTIGVNTGDLTALDAGDVVVGTFDFNSVSRLGGSSRLLGANSGGTNDALFGRFSLKVLSVSGSTISFGPSGAFGTYGMFEVYTAATNTVDNTTVDAGFSDAAFASADLYAVLGFDAVKTSAYDFGVTGSVPDLKFSTLASAALNGVTIANTTSIKLYVVADGTGDGGEAIGNTNVIGSIGGFPPSGNNFDGSGSIIGTGGAKFDSTTAFQTKLTIVPIPAAIWPGMALLGALGVGRLRRHNA
jgi:hypothetical protein